MTKTRRGRATAAELDELHGLVGEFIAYQMRTADPVTNPLQPAMLGQCLKFLAGNEANRPAFGKKVRHVDDVPDLSDGVPSFDYEDGE